MQWHKISEELPSEDQLVIIYPKPGIFRPKPTLAYLFLYGRNKEKRWYMQTRWGMEHISLEMYPHWAEIEPPN